MARGRIDGDAVLDEVRARLASASTAPSKDWARTLVAKYRAGERVHRFALEMAWEVLGMAPEPVVMRPRRGVQRPDARDRQAGDVEVDF